MKCDRCGERIPGGKAMRWMDDHILCPSCWDYEYHKDEREGEDDPVESEDEDGENDSM